MNRPPTACFFEMGWFEMGWSGLLRIIRNNLCRQVPLTSKFRSSSVHIDVYRD
jgi:hypothetical protein